MKLTKDNTHRFGDSKVTFSIVCIYSNLHPPLAKNNRKNVDAVDNTSQVHFTQVTDITECTL